MQPIIKIIGVCINTTLRHYHTALEMIPADAVGDLGVTHQMLGAVYGDAGQLDRAVNHYNQGIRYQEAGGNYYEAAKTRFNVAIDFARSNRIPDARAALRNYEMYGERAAAETEKTKGLIQKLEGLNKNGQDG